MGKLITLTALLVSSLFAHAEMLVMTPGPVVKNGVKISLFATAVVEHASYNLTTVGSGLRNHKIIFEIPVYIAQLMVADAARYVKTEAGALPSLDIETSVAIRLSFLRDVDAKTVANSFQDAFDANKIDPKDADILKFVSLVNANGDVKNGASMSIFITKNADGTETLAYENTSGSAGIKTFTGTKGLLHKVLSIWLGVSADAELAALKTELMQ